MDAAFLEELKNALRKEHDTLVAELKSIAQQDPKNRNNWNAAMPQFEPSEHGSRASLEEEADEVEEYEVRLEAEHSLESRLLEVNKALDAIQNGTYSICQKCKKEIPMERLRANPAALFHVGHTR